GLLDALARFLLWGGVVAACARIAARLLRSSLTGLAHVVWDGGAGLALLIALVLTIGLVPGGFGPIVLRCLLVALMGVAAVLARTDRVARFRGEIGPVVPGLIVVAVAGLAWDRVPPVFFDAR